MSNIHLVLSSVESQLSPVESLRLEAALSWQMSSGVCVGRVELPHQEKKKCIRIVVIINDCNPIIGPTACRL
jgi:hypothetical protein